MAGSLAVVEGGRGMEAGMEAGMETGMEVPAYEAGSD